MDSIQFYQYPSSKPPSTTKSSRPLVYRTGLSSTTTKQAILRPVDTSTELQTVSKAIDEAGRKMTQITSGAALVHTPQSALSCGIGIFRKMIDSAIPGRDYDDLPDVCDLLGALDHVKVCTPCMNANSSYRSQEEDEMKVVNVIAQRLRNNRLVLTPSATFSINNSFQDRYQEHHQQNQQQHSGEGKLSSDTGSVESRGTAIVIVIDDDSDSDSDGDECGADSPGGSSRSTYEIDDNNTTQRRNGPDTPKAEYGEKQDGITEIGPSTIGISSPSREDASQNLSLIDGEGEQRSPTPVAGLPAQIPVPVVDEVQAESGVSRLDYVDRLTRAQREQYAPSCHLALDGSHEQLNELHHALPLPGSLDMGSELAIPSSALEKSANNNTAVDNAQSTMSSRKRALLLDPEEEDLNLRRSKRPKKESWKVIDARETAFKLRSGKAGRR